MGKPIMRIGMAGRAVTHNGKYSVNWGTTGSAYNNQYRSFNTRKQAIAFKDLLIRRFRKAFTIQYIYMAD